jgi:hypothetical protein
MPTGKWTGVVVLDVDPEKGGFESLLTLIRRYGVLPWTRVLHTGSELAFYFEHPGIHTRSFGGKMGRRLRASSAQRTCQEQDLAVAGVWDSEP